MNVVIVNEQDEVIGVKERADIQPKDIYRVAALWIENSKGEVLLAQRAFTKKNNPGKWGPAVAGTVEEGEEYDTNILKEMEEEIGLVNTPVQKRDKRFRDGPHRYFCQWFYAVVDEPIESFVVAEEEVEALRWWPVDELKEECAKDATRFLRAITEWVGCS